MTSPDQLEHFYLETLYSQILEFEGKARATQLEHISDASFLGKLLVLPANVRLDWNLVASYKHSNLFGLVVNDEGKKFYNIDTKNPYWWERFSMVDLLIKIGCFVKQKIFCQYEKADDLN